jgi:hypothetical protein
MSRGARIAPVVGWHLLAVALSAVSLLIGAFAMLITLAAGGAIPIICSDGDPHFDTPPISAYLPAAIATLIGTVALAVVFAVIFRHGRVASPRVGGAAMALLGPASLGLFVIVTTYLGYREQGPNTPCSRQEQSHSLDWVVPVWGGVVVVFLLVSLIRTARARRELRG